MDLKELQKLIKVITDTDITEFELKQDNEMVLIRRGQDKEVVTVAAPAPVAAPAAVAPTQPVVDEAQTAVAPVKAETGGDIITSPMVGTFYRKPSPDADPFAEEGTVIEAGHPLCIVEAMKLFNEIEAEFKCRVVEILKEDSQPVEFGEPLFKVERL